MLNSITYAHILGYLLIFEAIENPESTVLLLSDIEIFSRVNLTETLIGAIALRGIQDFIKSLLSLSNIDF